MLFESNDVYVYTLHISWRRWQKPQNNSEILYFVSQGNKILLVVLIDTNVRSIWTLSPILLTAHIRNDLTIKSCKMSSTQLTWRNIKFARSNLIRQTINQLDIFIQFFRIMGLTIISPGKFYTYPKTSEPSFEHTVQYMYVVDQLFRLFDK